MKKAHETISKRKASEEALIRQIKTDERIRNEN